MAVYQALYRTYRPRTFDQVVGQTNLIETLKHQVDNNRLSHAYLFTGTRGTGKTSCAKILSRAVNCLAPVNGNPCNQCDACVGIEKGAIMDVLELDAASNNGVDQVRALRDEAIYTPASVRKRVYIIDEVHMLSTSAFNALLKILEEPPSHLMFILATTELHKVPATIKSRCQMFAFQRIGVEDMSAHVQFVAQQEGISLTPEGATLLARLADGGLRDALSLLDQCMTPDHQIGEGEILSALGLAGNLETAQLMAHLLAGETTQSLQLLARLYQGGKEVGSLLGELSSLVRDLLVYKTAPKGGMSLLVGGYEKATLDSLSTSVSGGRLVHMLTILQSASAQMKLSTNRRTDTELCLIRLCDPALDDSMAGLQARVAQLEEGMARGVPMAAPVAKAPPIPQKNPPVMAEAPSWEDTPPWEKAPPPPKQAAPKAPPPVPTSAPAPASPSSSVSPQIWPGILSAIKGKFAPLAPFLTNPAMVQGQLEDTIFTLWVNDNFTKGMVSKPEVLTAIAQTASAMTQKDIRTQVKIGTPPTKVSPTVPPPSPVPPPAPSIDKLDDLVAFGQQFDNIIIK